MREPSTRAEGVGRIFDIQRCSLHDGPGIRTTVFLKGCGLRCAWCHNPEGLTPDPILSFLPEKCIGCGWCFRTCPRQAHEMVEGRHILDRSVCAACGRCAQECHAGALEIVGREVTADEVLAVALRDRVFYESSGGGLTLSGGEPLLQPAFCAAVLRKAKEIPLHCCIETSGFCQPDALDSVAQWVDLFLFDWKESDPARHARYCGADFERILANLRALHDAGRPIRLRCPIIPGFNDRPDHLEGIAALAQSLPRLKGVELLPYHRLGESKRRRFGMEEPPAQSGNPADSDIVKGWTGILEQRGLVVTHDGKRGQSLIQPACSP